MGRSHDKPWFTTKKSIWPLGVIVFFRNEGKFLSIIFDFFKNLLKFVLYGRSNSKIFSAMVKGVKILWKITLSKRVRVRVFLWHNKLRKRKHNSLRKVYAKNCNSLPSNLSCRSQVDFNLKIVDYCDQGRIYHGYLF